MEKRKAYIITALIILISITVLAFWYLYTARKELEIGQVTELDFYGVGESLGRPNDTSAPSGGFGAAQDVDTAPTANSLNEIIPPTVPEDASEEETLESWELLQIHTDPVVGISITDGVIQYVDQKTGNILQRTKDGEQERLSGIVIKKVREAYKVSPEVVTLLHDSDMPPTEISLIGEQPTSTETNLTGIMQSVSESNGHLYYTTPNTRGGIDIKSTQDTTQVLWSSFLSEWLLQVVDEYIVVTQKASRNIPGYAYILPKTGIKSGTNPTPLVQDAPGLITNLSPDGAQLLYSTSGTRTTLYLKKMTSSTIIPLTISTTASKCVWGADSTTFYCAVPSSVPSNMPESWYKGQTHFTDTLWRINAQTGDAFELVGGTGLDVVAIVEDASHGIIAFKNKFDQSLWALIRQ